MRRVFLATAAAALFSLGSAAAQEVESSDSILIEEIVVTAQKREQALQDVGISVTAFTGDQLKALGFTNSIDVVTQTPGLTYGTPTGAGNNANLALRGVSLNDFNDNNESPIAVYVDEVYYSALSGVTFQLFDLERVEILRGPQGTLFGRNASGGLAHFITAKPRIGGELDGYAEVSLGRFDEVKAEVGIGGPIGDKAAIRLSVARSSHDGFVKNRVGKDLSNNDNLAGRLQLAYQPTDGFEVLLNMHASKNDAREGSWQHRATKLGADGIDTVFLPDGEDFYGTCPGCDAFGYKDTDSNPWAGAYNRQGALIIENEGASAKFAFTMPSGIEVVSLTAYEQFERFYEEDTDLSPAPLIEPTFGSDIEQFTQEFRVSGTVDRLRWLTGFYYYDQKTVGDLSLDLTALDFFFMDVAYTQKTESWAAFGQFEFAVSDQLALTAGVRFTDETKTYRYLSQDTSGFTAAIGLPTNVLFDFSRATAGNQASNNEDNISWRFAADWTPNDDLLVYGVVSRGYKLGGFNAGFLDATGLFGANAVEEIAFKQEKLTSYEIGFKSTLLNGLARFNASAYYYDYKNFQALTFRNIAQSIFNVDANIKGAEVEIVVNPTEGLDLLIGASYIDAEAENVADPFGTPRDRRMVLAPEAQLNWLARYRYPLGAASVSVQVDGNYQSKAFFDIQNFTSSKENGYSIWNTRVAINSPGDRWEIAAFVQNLFNEKYLVYTFDFTPAFGFSQQGFGKPRWWGIALTYRFGG